MRGVYLEMVLYRLLAFGNRQPSVRAFKVSKEIVSQNSECVKRDRKRVRKYFVKTFDL